MRNSRVTVSISPDNHFVINVPLGNKKKEMKIFQQELLKLFEAETVADAEVSKIKKRNGFYSFQILTESDKTCLETLANFALARLKLDKK